MRGIGNSCRICTTDTASLSTDRSSIVGPNCGAIRARNRCLNMVRGPWVTFVPQKTRGLNVAPFRPILESAS